MKNEQASKNEEITKKMNRPPFYKQKIFVNVRLQLELILFFYIATIITLVTVYLGVSRTMQDLFTQCSFFGATPATVCESFLSKTQSSINFSFLCGFIIATTISIGGGIILSHRIAGPVYRLGRYFKQVGQGTIKKISLRKGDYFRDVAETYNNEVVEKLKNQDAKNKE